MKKNSILYIVLMIIFLTFAYLLIYSGVNTLVKINIPYQENSQVEYLVSLKENDIYNENTLGMNKNYITKLVDDIVIDFNYQAVFTRDLSGYYSYGVGVDVVAYEDDINDPLWIKEEEVLEDKVEVLNKNKIRDISIQDKVVIDYDKYKGMIDNFKNDYNISVSGYLMVKINVHMMNNFRGIDNDIMDDKVIKVIIPLSYDTFKIRVINDYNKIDNYYEFTKKSDVNYLLLILGCLSGAIGIAFMSLIIKEMIEISNSESKYTKELKHILKEYSEEIVNVDKLYNKKKYNLIYVNSFDELMDVYKRVESPISYKEIDKNKCAVFVIMEEYNAWIYQLVSDREKKK